MTTPLPRPSTGLRKTELIKPRKPWRPVDEAGYVTAEWVDWFNNDRLYQ